MYVNHTWMHQGGVQHCARIRVTIYLCGEGTNIIKKGPLVWCVAVAG